MSKRDDIKVYMDKKVIPSNKLTKEEILKESGWKFHWSDEENAYVIFDLFDL